MKNTIVLLIMFLFIAAVSFSGTFFWHDGVIVRGPEINSALDEKVDVDGATYFQLTPQSSFATSSAEVGTVYMNATGAINFLSTGTTWMTIIATTTGLEW